MKLLEMEWTRTEIGAAGVPAYSASFFRLAARCLKAFWRSLVSRAGSKRKTLAVRETAALGDRRFVCVIQHERRRFLIGAGPSSVTLLAQLPDESVGGESEKESGERN